MIALGLWATEPHFGNGSRPRRRRRRQSGSSGIVPIYEVGQVAGQHYFTMKLIDGISLEQLLARSHRARRAAAIVATVGHAIHYAHERGESFTAI